MKKLPALIPVLAAFFVLSCQKEVEDIFKVNDGVNTSGRLRREVISEGADSIARDFLYNNSGKVIAVNEIEYSGGSMEFSSQTIDRNSQGVIQRLIFRASSLPGIDSLVYNVGSSSGKYTNKVMRLSFLGTNIIDSTVYTYDAGGKITSSEGIFDDGFGSVTHYRYDYTYLGANLASMTGYDLGSGSPVLVITQQYEFDNKVSPLIAGNEAHIINDFTFWYSANNLQKMTVNVVGDPDTHVQNFTYMYNPANKPTSSTATGGGQTITTRYYYN